MTVTIRSGGPADFETAAQIYFVSGTARRDGRPIEDWRMEQIRAEIATPDAWLFMAEDDGVPIAMAEAMPSRLETGDRDLVPGLCYLGLIFVLPERWGEGIGAQLLDLLMAEAVNRGFTRVHLWTHENNDRAHAMYLRRGFDRTGKAHPSGNDADINVEEWARDL